MTMLAFGPFMLDDRSLELWRDGRRVAIRPQPCRLLALLVSRAGELVTRDEVAAALWPGVHVRVDLGLNSCVKQIRAALGDDASRPRWIETLTRRGYRFLGHVRPDARDPVPGARRLLVLPVRAVAPGGDVNAPLLAVLGAEIEATLLHISPGLAVVATASLCDGDVTAPPLRALAEADIDLVLDCRVYCAAPNARIAVQLINVAERVVVWAGMFDGDISNRVDTQRTIAREIGDAVHGLLAFDREPRRLAG